MTLNEAKEILLKQALCEHQCSCGCVDDCKTCAFAIDISDMRYTLAVSMLKHYYIKKYAKTHLSAVYGESVKEGETNDIQTDDR